MDVAAQATSGLKDVANTGKKHYLIVAAIALVGLVLVVRNADTIKGKLAGWFPSLKSLFGVAAALALVLGTFLYAGDAFAAVCCAKPALEAAVHSGGFGSAVWGTVAALGSGAAIFGSILGNTAPDIREAKLENGDKFKTFAQSDYTNEPNGAAIDFYVDGDVNITDKGRPMLATAQVLEVLATIDQVSTGTDPIEDDDLARMVSTVKMDENKLLGTIQDDTVGTGPIIKNILEFYGLGYNRGADAPVAAITTPAPSSSGPATHNTKTYTRYFTMPHANGLMADPMATALWLKLIHKMVVRVQMAKPGCLDSVSTGALLTGNATVRLTTPFQQAMHWRWPMLCQNILERPAGGTETVTLRKFGEKNASGTEPVDYLYGLLRLSNLAGLPGNVTFDQITQIDSEKLGIARLQNIPAWVKPRLEAQRAGLSPQGFDNGNYQAGTIPTGMNVGDLKALALIQPGLAMQLGNTKPIGKGFELPISYTYSGGVPSGQDAYVAMSIRKLDLSCGPRLAEMSGGKLLANGRDSAPLHYRARR